MPSDGIINSKTLLGQLRPFKTHHPPPAYRTYRSGPLTNNGSLDV
jgi:hypothetical protein